MLAYRLCLLDQLRFKFDENKITSVLSSNAQKPGRTKSLFWGDSTILSNFIISNRRCLVLISPLELLLTCCGVALPTLVLAGSPDITLVVHRVSRAT